MFNQVKVKLTSIYTLSMLCLLLIFITSLYILISHAINEGQLEEVQSYFNKNKFDFIEDLYEKEHKGISYEPNQRVFFYVYNKNGEFVYGEESEQSLFKNVKSYFPANGSSTKRVVWNQNHLILSEQPLKINGTTHGYVILGMNITSEVHLIQYITYILLILTIFFSLLFAFMGYYFAGQAMKPIKRAFVKQEKFVSDASHELRTPLSIFYSSIDLLTTEEMEKLSPFGQEVLHDLKIETELMNNLVKGLLFLARNDQDQINLEIKEVNLSNLVMSACKSFSRRITNQVMLEQNIETNLFFACDEMKIRQLLYILLDNAFRYTKEGKVTVTLESKDENKVITVKDTGCGISPDDLPHIFDRFYRADVAREKGGAGLGLSIAQSIVKLHRGRIVASSTPGMGTLITIIF